MESEILSVTQAREYINQTLSYAYPLVVIEGEVSSFRLNQAKWIFFDLKDAESTLSCFMTKYQLNTVLEDGMLVRVTATPNLTKWGKFSLTVKYVELAGEGTVKQAFEKLKAQFETEGLFEVSRKRLLPDYPTAIGLITSSDAAAYNDFVSVARDRWPLMQINHVHVHVQGVQAPGDVVAAIELLNKDYSDLEAIVLIRGGGSAEDLQAFNQENVVRAVYASQIPTIVGIGHEDDVSLAELAADVRAATPTDAARRITPDRIEVERQISQLRARQWYQLEQLVLAARNSIRRLVDTCVKVELYASQGLTNLLQRLDSGWQAQLSGWRFRLIAAAKTIHGSDPTRLLARGYAIVRQSDKIIRNPAEVRYQSEILVQFSKGWLKAQPLISEEEINDQDQQQSIDFSH